ncbi:ABC transporter substrate-binding protein [Aliikangiella maris]|uniref:ABC transporter substrate-binding protein n=2 Tax=Aliikangiella maris TaxID=3162458 RepID=A0ABV3MRZ8_9GAMM
MRFLFLLMGFIFSLSSISATEEPIRIGTTLWPGYEPIHLAKSLGKLEPHNIRTIDYPSTSEVLRAFKNHTLEVAALTLDEVVSLVENDTPVKIILICDISNGGDVILAKPSIKNVTQLKGKRVAVESSAVGAYLLSRALQLNDVQLKDIQVVNMDVNSNMAALKQDKADAFVTYDPIKTRLLNEGLTPIFSSNQIPGEVVDVLVVHESFYLQHAEKIHALVDAWFVALNEIQKNPLKSYRFIANRMKISVDEVAKTYEGLILPNARENFDLLTGEHPKLRETMERLVNLMQHLQLISQKPSLSNLITDEFIPQQ